MTYELNDVRAATFVLLQATLNRPRRTRSHREKMLQKRIRRDSNLKKAEERLT